MRNIVIASSWWRPSWIFRWLVGQICLVYLMESSCLFWCLYHEVHDFSIIRPTNSHLCSLKCHHIFFPYGPGLTSMQHAASHTTTVQPSSHNQWYVLIGKQWYQLLELISTNSNSGLHSCVSISLKLKLTENKFITTLCKLYTSTTALHKQTCRHGTILRIR